MFSFFMTRLISEITRLLIDDTRPPERRRRGHLELVVDNTKKAA